MVGELSVDAVAGRRRGRLPASVSREIVNLLRAGDRRHVGVWGWAAGSVRQTPGGANGRLAIDSHVVRTRQRKLDCEILWRDLVGGAEGDIRWAQNAMLLHAMSDAAWRDELTEIEIYRAIAGLTEHEMALEPIGASGLSSRASWSKKPPVGFPVSPGGYFQPGRNFGARARQVQERSSREGRGANWPLWALDRAWPRGGGAGWIACLVLCIRA